MLLTELPQGEKAIISRIRGRSSFRKRILEMGFVPGKEVKTIRRASFKGPIEFSILGSYVVLRYSEAELIEYEPTDYTAEPEVGSFSTFSEDDFLIPRSPVRSEINVVLIGNPISGKTSLFNYLTGSHERVGNYSGVTVEPIASIIEYKGYHLKIVDLPGTYSVGSDQHVNRVIRDYIFQEVPDVVINVVDATNLERNLFLTTDLIDMDVRLVMALNTFGARSQSRDQFDYHAFGKITGVPVVPVDAIHGEGKTALCEAILAMYTDSQPDYRHIHIYYGAEVEQSIRLVQSKIRIPENSFLTDRFSSRFLSIRLLNKDNIALFRIENCPNKEEIIRVAEEEMLRLRKVHGQSSEGVISDAKYGFIAGALKETLTEAVQEKRKFSDRIDGILMHKWFGFPIFIALMWLMFFSTFKLGVYPMNWIGSGVVWISSVVTQFMAPGMLRDLIVDGVISGMGGVIVFLPNILILYFFIALMEDTGYMSRAVFLMDRLMHKIGLHGKSFIPLVMGFGCNVPAILSSRILENKNERLITILINPFISCNARLPVYVLFISAFFPNNSGTVLFSIYALGVAIAILTALVLRKTLFKTAAQPFVMELPPYRMPTRKALLMHMWRRGAQYLKKIGGVILIASVIFWALSYFPRHPAPAEVHQKKSIEVAQGYDQQLNRLTVNDSIQRNIIELERADALSQLKLAEKREQKEHSYLGRIGRFIEPVIRPLGFDWRIGISIISGIPAKEIIVSSLSILYQVDETAENREGTLVNKLRTFHQEPGKERLPGAITPLIALSFMVFVLLYLPCIGTLTAISRETGSWKWGAFMLVYSFSVAWLLSFIIFQVGTLLGY